MKRLITQLSIALALLLITAGVAYAGTIDPNNDGSYKAVIENTDLGSATSINFGKFTTQSAKNITVSDSELRGYAWGEGVGWIVMNCADATSGCSSTNGNFKVANDGNGNLSGYAWGENTGWINFGPFTNASISTVKIANGEFGGTLGSAGYAWSQNYGFIKFDCASASSCVKTDWAPTTSNPGGGGGGGPSGGGGHPPTNVCSDQFALNLGGALPCVYPNTPSLCVDVTAINFGGNLPCQYPIQTQTCTDLQAINYGANGSCQYAPPSQLLCADSSAMNEGQPLPCVYAGSVCDTNPSDPNCIGTPPPPTKTFCQQYPEKCLPTNTQTRSDVIGKVVKEFLASTTGTIAKIAGAAALGIGLGASFILANPFSLYDILLWLARLWSLLLVALGLKKKAEPWGTVYDSVTKQPIDPAYVVLMDMEGKEIATCITDIEGRYGFAVPPGTYQIVANKTNYEFPSKKLAGKTEDELYNDLYFGGPIVIEKEGDIIAKDIPLDQFGFDWNEYAKGEQRRLRHFKRRDLTIARISNTLFVIGFIITGISSVITPSPFNLILLGVYVVLAIVRITGWSIKPKGTVADAATSSPLPFSVVRLFSKVTNKEVTHKVADSQGQYYALVPNGEYSVVVDRKNQDATYTSVPQNDGVRVTKGYLKRTFKI